jgi:zinc protease
MNIQFECAPNRVDELNEIAKREIKKYREQGVPRKDIKKVSALLWKHKSQEVKNNSHWMGVLDSCEYYDEGITSEAFFEEIIHSLSFEDVHQFV